MSKFEVKNSEGKKVAEAELAAEVYGIEPNTHVMHHIVVAPSRGARRAPVVPARVPSAPASGVTVASSTAPSRVCTPSA